MSARQAALAALDGIERHGLPMDRSLAQALRRHRLSARDRALVTELGNGVLRRRSYIDAVLDPLLHQGVASLDQLALNILRLGAYQLLYLDRVPAHAAVNETVSLARSRSGPGRAGLINAVLRRLQREGPRPSIPSAADDPRGHLSLVYSLPGWMVDRWIQQLGLQEAEELMRALDAHPGITVRANTCRITPGELVVQLASEAIATRPGRWLAEALQSIGSFWPPDLKSFRAGLFSVQDEGAMIVSHVLNPRAGRTYLDACAAPGGKTTHLAQLAGPGASIVAVDVDARRLQAVEAECRRLGITSVNTAVADARHPERIAGGPFDGVLVDAPCSGLGVVRRRPDIKWRKNPADPASMSKLQLELLLGARELVRGGGTLVYAVCSTEPEETLQVVEKFQQRAGDMVADSLVPYLPGGLRSETTASQGRLWLWPHRHGTDGFFVARWLRGRTPSGCREGS